MEEILEIPLTYRGEQLFLKARVLSYCYCYKIAVDISGKQLMFEADEEGKYRAVAQVGALQKEDKVDIGLLEAIALLLDAQIKQ